MNNNNYDEMVERVLRNNSMDKIYLTAEERREVKLTGATAKRQIRGQIEVLHQVAFIDSIGTRWVRFETLYEVVQ